MSNWRLHNAQDLERAREQLKSRDSDLAGEALCHLAKRNGYNILRDALEKGFTDVAKVMLKLGVRVNNITGKQVDSPLHIAALKGDTEIVELLLSAGAKINALNGQGETALFVAVQKNHVHVVRLLVTGNADVNIKQRWGKTPLHYSKTAEMVKLLVSFGANVNAESGWRCDTPLNKAILERRNEVVQALLECKADVNFCVWKTPLMESVFTGDADLTLLLLNNGAKVNARSYQGALSPLHQAVKGRHGDIVKVLLSTSDIEVDSKTREGQTALHLAVQEEFNAVTVKALVENGASINVQDGSGRSPLHLAVKNHDTVLFLLDHGADVNLKDHAGRAALHYAVPIFGNSSLSFLLKYGANINIQDNYGKSPLHISIEKGYSSCASILINRGVKIDLKDNSGRTQLHYAAERAVEGPLLALLIRGANVNARDTEGKTPLHLYSEVTNIVGLSEFHFASVLLRHGADIDSKDMYGKTALHVAAENNRPGIVEALLEYGADVNFRTDVTPYHTPCQCSTGRAAETLQNHIVMLKALNFPVDEANLKSIDFNSSNVQTFQTQCENEVTHSKEVKLFNGDKTISFYDILTKNRIKLSLFGRHGISSGVSDVLKLQLREFPIFREMIALHFRLIAERVPLLQEVSVLLGDLFSIPPGICVEAITDYLKNEDLKSLIAACRSINE